MNERESINRQPFSMDVLVEFAGTKKSARLVAFELGQALIMADRARERGECHDVVFDSFFWDGQAILSDDDVDECELRLASIEKNNYASEKDEDNGIRFWLAFRSGRRFFVVDHGDRDDGIVAWRLFG